MSIQLRDYQQRLKKDLSRAIFVDKHKAVIAQAPGGTGKTKTFISICNDANRNGFTVLVMTDKTKVFKQIARESNGITIGGKGSKKYVEVYEGVTYIAMAQTLRNRPLIISQFNLLDKPVIVIVDEVHVSTCKSVLDQLVNRLTIGFTATPDFRIAKHLPELFDEIVTTEPIQWFIDNGYLCDYQHIMRKSGEGVKNIKKKGGEYDEKEQRKFFGTDLHYQELFKDLTETQYNKGMIFTASIEHCEEVYIRLVEAGFKCSISHSKRQDDARQIFEFERQDGNDLIISVGSLTTGYDYPPVDLVVLYRATTSLALYLQMIFRADRICEGKRFFTVLDYGLNFEKHNAYNFPHDWSLMWKEKRRKESDGVVTYKQCPNCDSMILASDKVCKWCHFELPKPEENLKDLGKMVEVTGLKAKIQGKRLSELNAKELALYAHLYKRKPFAQRVARCRGILIEYASEMGYDRRWAEKQVEIEEKIISDRVSRGEKEEDVKADRNQYFDIVI